MYDTDSALSYCLNEINSRYAKDDAEGKNRALFDAALSLHFPRLFNILNDIYGHRFDFHHQLTKLTQILYQSFVNRSDTLRALDEQRKNSPDWYQKSNMLGMAVYVDLFAGDLEKLKGRIPYLQDLGVTYLHLMPLYAVPKGESDGGYAVSDYRQVNPQLGSMQDLSALAEALNEAGISLVLDFVFNHTSDEHPWAQAAKAGDKQYQNYYWMFDDKYIPEQYEANLREIFPQVRRGNFTFDEASQKWVWTTFNSFQWDLNYANPEVFNAITSEMLFLANIGCQVLRLDALAFIWKEMGTTCENQENAHKLIQAFNACLQIVAPAVAFKSEAIVHPDEVAKYISLQECQISYNPLLMALLWESLATRNTQLLTASMQKSFDIDPACSWVNYVRCHDDVGWTFDDAVANQLHIDGHGHRYFLNQFYTGRFEGSFAKGEAFQENPSNGDCRVCGSAASLAGLEQALALNDPILTQHAIDRVLMIHGIILSIGGIPLLYAGDELALLNDYRYRDDPLKQHDSRWVHRIAHTDEAMAIASDASSAQFAIAQGLKKLIQLRKQHEVFGQGLTRIIDTHNPHLFSFVRTNKAQSVLVMANFSEHPQRVSDVIISQLGKASAKELLSGEEWEIQQREMELRPYQLMWIVA